MFGYSRKRSACSRRRLIIVTFLKKSLRHKAFTESSIHSLFSAQPFLRAYLTSSTLNFVISDSGVQERHSPLRDIQPQSCRQGTEMLGTSACWLHMWPAWSAVPLKCLSNAGWVKETTSSVDGKERLFLSYRRTCKRKQLQSMIILTFWGWLHWRLETNSHFCQERRRFTW